jgi:transcriptional regulator with XRE-family HTH domain
LTLINQINEFVAQDQHMRRSETSLSATPFAVETAIKRLGTNLRTARLRRNLTLVQVAQKLGVSRYVVAHAEAGKPTTSLAVYAGLLWAYGLLDQFADLADPAKDKEGLALSLANDRSHARRREALDNDF